MCTTHLDRANKVAVRHSRRLGGFASPPLGNPAREWAAQKRHTWTLDFGTALTSEHVVSWTHFVIERPIPQNESPPPRLGCWPCDSGLRPDPLELCEDADFPQGQNDDGAALCPHAATPVRQGDWLWRREPARGAAVREQGVRCPAVLVVEPRLYLNSSIRVPLRTRLAAKTTLATHSGAAQGILPTACVSAKRLLGLSFLRVEMRCRDPFHLHG